MAAAANWLTPNRFHSNGIDLEYPREIPEQPHFSVGKLQRQDFALLTGLNGDHLKRLSDEAGMETRVTSSEKVAWLKTAAVHALDISG